MKNAALATLILCAVSFIAYLAFLVSETFLTISITAVMITIPIITIILLILNYYVTFLSQLNMRILTKIVVFF